MNSVRGIGKSAGSLGRFIRVFWPYAKTQWRLAALGMVGLLGGTLLRILEPWPLKFVIDRITGQSAERARVSLAWVEGLDLDTLLMVAALALVLIASIRAAATYVSTVGFALAGNRTLTAVRAALFRHLQNLSLRFHGKSRGGDIVVRMVGDVGMVQEVAVTAVLPLLGSVLVLFGMFAVMFWLDPSLALIAVAVLPILAFATLRRGRTIQSAARRTRKQEGALAATASESISAIKTIQSLSLGDRFSTTFSSQNNKSLSEGVRVKRLSAGLERGVDVLIAVATAAVLWYGASRVAAGYLSAGELLVFLFYLKGAFRPVKDFAKYGARLAKASAAGERIIELFETRAEINEAPDATELVVNGGEVRFENVRFGYEAGVNVLDGFNLVINSGTHLAVIGPSGSGKSTIAGLLLRLYDPAAGAVRVDGADLRGVRLDSLRSSISTVLQDTILFAATVRENIAFGVDNPDQEAVERAARLAGAHEFIVALPEGYDTLLGERGVNLSNGQRQRIAIARAALRDAPIVILDEPTTGLDPETENQVMQALHRVTRGKTVLHITHRMNAARFADYIVCVKGGEIIEQGSHADLLAERGYFAELNDDADGGGRRRVVGG